MSRLTEMRQRIKTIHTIKKVTHAMRMTAIASHATTKKTLANLNIYTEELQNIFSVLNLNKTENTSINHNNTSNGTKLCIIIGSQKGLCGTFNTSITEYCKHYYVQQKATIVDYIVIGKKLIEELPKNIPIISHIPTFGQNTLNTVLQNILTHTKQYTNIDFIYNYPKTFFSHLPITASLSYTLSNHQQKNIPDHYMYYENPLNIYEDIKPELALLHIKTILIRSLNAESAARFVAMDSSTRNATESLNTMQIAYNKLRQAEITKEINDLSAIF